MVRAILFRFARTQLSSEACPHLIKKYFDDDSPFFTGNNKQQQQGADPDEVAISILESVAAGKSDIVIAATFSARVAMWLKFLVPSILDRILAKRFEKQRVAMKKNE
jgi:short-subunit dehydrogenase